MESEQSSFDSLDSTTDKVPKIPLVMPGEIDPPPPRSMAIPSVVRRGAAAVKPSVAVAKPAPTFTWPIAPAKPREPGAWKPPSPPATLSRPSMPAAQLPKLAQPKLTKPTAATSAPLTAVQPAVPVTVTPIVEPAPVVVEPAPIAVEPAPIAVEPAPIAVEPAPIAVEPAPIAVEPAPRTSRKRRVARASNDLPTAPPPVALEAPPTFGAGMLSARTRRAKQPAHTDLSIALPSASAVPQFGAGMLQARRSRGKLVVAIVVAAVTIAALGLAMRGGEKPAGTPAATQQKT